MKLFGFAIIIALSSAFIRQPADGAEFLFKETKHKFQDTNEGVLLTHEFHFKNVGDQPLIISSYKVACTCTKIEFSEQPILPDQSGIIKLIFDTNGKSGLQNRKIEIISNALKTPVILSFKVYVIPAD